MLVAFCHIIFQSIPPLWLPPFTLTDYPQFYGLEVLLSNLLRSNNKMVIFSKTEKNFISQNTNNGPYNYDIHMEGGMGVLKFITCLQIFLLLKKRSIVNFCGWTRWGPQNWSFFWRLKCMNPKWSKIATNSIIISNSFFFSIKPGTFWLHREQTQALLPPLTPLPLQ